jgi:hypothetical protein
VLLPTTTGSTVTGIVLEIVERDDSLAEAALENVDDLDPRPLWRLDNAAGRDFFGAKVCLTSDLRALPDGAAGTRRIVATNRVGRGGVG